MTKTELNRKIKVLKKVALQLRSMTATDEYYDLEKSFKLQLQACYKADKEFLLMNRNNIVFMLRMNIRYRFVPLHTFGLYAVWHGIEGVPQ